MSDLMAEGVSLSFSGKPVLQDVSLRVLPGELHALIGPNGAGKSTLLAMLSGDRTPASGAVLLDGKNLGEWRPKELARERAVLTQDNTVTFPFTAAQIVEMGRAPWQRTPAEAEDERAIAEAVAQTDVAHLMDRTIPHLSGGERARVALARVLAQRAPIVLLDEPTAALDLRHQEDVLRIARDRARAGDAVVVVLHDLNLAAAYADRITLLSRGRIAASGTPSEVLTTARVEEVYGQRVEIIERPDRPPLIVPLR
ncbi:iron complex transport system ATP-binding protein [Mycetocola sp. BIGb0189]|uniref:heme ABC transporter ATP-binding protein n=1 Tax=Mycetocola sp. BIGb0189 TaxID=2940604 RepID=UPI002166D881|nr:heme ABC transporter ATP-binding protein [Mycetocola sp. BIGb0189]MCS4277364.1 iron complex transport system ATP-binding protein [Mycetocola sp. BIGb0189]